jgi:hypothetical protein
MQRQPSPERGRTRYRSFEYEQYEKKYENKYDEYSSFTPRIVDDPIYDLGDGDESPVEWQHYHYLPPHEPSPPTALSDLSTTWSCSSSERSISTSSCAYSSVLDGSFQTQPTASSPSPPPPPPCSDPKRSMVRFLVASTALYVANQTTLVAADALLQNGVGTWGRACIGINTILCCQTVMLAGWGLERVGRRRGGGREGVGAADRTWRKRWARVESWLGRAILVVAAVTVLGILLMGLGWAASR